MNTKKLDFLARKLLKNKILLNTKWQIDVISVIIEKGKKRFWHFDNAISYQS